MSKQANPTLIGAFVLGALILGIVTIFLLAEDTWLQERQQHVLYFEEAAQGLQVGAPVVFLGVKVGTVKHIQLGLEEGKKHFTVQVTIELDLQMIGIHSGELINPENQLTIRQLVDRGLRARLKMQSLLTGLLYVDSSAEDLHRHLNTVEKPLNQLGDAYLCPGSKALDALNAALR